MNLVFSAVTRGPAWANTVFVINYDEWGGFFDHVPPPDTQRLPNVSSQGERELLHAQNGGGIHAHRAARRNPRRGHRDRAE